MGLWLLCSPRTFFDGSVRSRSLRSFPVVLEFYWALHSGRRAALICLYKANLSLG